MEAMTVERYKALRTRLIEQGYGREIDWAESVRPVDDPENFWREYSFVVINAGMKAQVASGIWQRVRPAVENGGSAHDVFGHRGKAGAIDAVYAARDDYLARYLAAADKLAFLKAMPWIGPITSWHLAKNLGIDCAKPDRHLVRIAGAEGVAAMCARIAQHTGERIATVDMVLWRAANLGLA